MIANPLSRLALTPFALATVLCLTLGLPTAAQETDAADETPAEAPATEAPVPEAPSTEAPAADAPATGDAPAADADPAPAEAPAQPGGALSAGETVGQSAGNGPEIYTREEHGAWEVRCLRAPEGQTDPCQLFQRLSDQSDNPTADVNFFDLPDGEEIVAGATILTPLQTLLTSQVTMTIDGGQPRRYPFSFCDTAGCYSRMGFNAADMAAFRRGATATVVVVPALAPDQQAELTMSLSGFTAGFAAVEVPNEE